MEDFRVMISGKYLPLSSKRTDAASMALPALASDLVFGAAMGSEDG